MDMDHLLTQKLKAETYLTQQNVVGVAIGYKTIEGEETDQLSVQVLVEKKLPKAALRSLDVIQPYITDVPTDVIQVGKLTAQINPKEKWRPAVPGVSIGHYQITAGTFGAVVTEKGTGIKLILSNNHVLANSNDAKLGDPILQPGPYDGGKELDMIASLYRVVMIDFGEEIPDEPCPLEQAYVKIGNWLAKLLRSERQVFTKKVHAYAENFMDAALAIPNNQNLIDDVTLWIGQVEGVAEAHLGQRVQKAGRTTNHTTNKITGLHATVTVDYGAGKSAVFKEQIITGAMSQGGDSGSLLVDLNNKAVGLLFAGSSQATIHSPIQPVLDDLGVEI